MMWTATSSSNTQFAYRGKLCLVPTLEVLCYCSWEAVCGLPGGCEGGDAWRDTGHMQHTAPKHGQLACLGRRLLLPCLWLCGADIAAAHQTKRYPLAYHKSRTRIGKCLMHVDLVILNTPVILSGTPAIYTSADLASRAFLAQCSSLGNLSPGTQQDIWDPTDMS